MLARGAEVVLAECGEIRAPDALHLERIDEALASFELDQVGRVGEHASSVPEQRAELAQAPAQFCAGIIGHVPEQVTQLGTGDRPRAEQQISE